jgi:putative membrane protein
MANNQAEGPPEDPRVRLAAERTLLAWVRTGLALMGFGFVVARFGLFLRELALAHALTSAPGSGASLWIGGALVVLGVAVNLLAAREHVLFLRRLERGEPQPTTTWTLGVVVCLILAVLGGVILGYLVWVAH